MKRSEAITWLKVMLANLVSFPEVSNTKKRQALTYAIDSLNTDEAYQLMYEGLEVEEVVHAEWIWNADRFMYVCSKCGHNPTKGTGFNHDIDALNEHYHYCRYCGAKMDGGL